MGPFFETYFCFFITLKHNRQRDQVHEGENVLRKLNISSFIRNLVQVFIYPDMCAGIDQGASRPFDFLVVPFAFEIDGDLLHVR